MEYSYRSEKILFIGSFAYRRSFPNFQGNPWADIFCEIIPRPSFKAKKRYFQHFKGSKSSEEEKKHFFWSIFSNKTYFRGPKIIKEKKKHFFWSIFSIKKIFRGSKIIKEMKYALFATYFRQKPILHNLKNTSKATKLEKNLDALPNLILPKAQGSGGRPLHTMHASF